uniref:Dpoe2NT domain-containing protein n=1 Tax=Macrostomum lignano TaxID=282301 RepID=A0A1I8HQ82_9PLAT
MSQTEVRTQLSKAFRLHGLSLHPEATRTILAAMEHSGQAAVNPAQVIDRLVEAVLRLPLNSCHVQRSEIESLVAEQLLSGTAAAAAAIAADSPWLQVFDAFDPAAPNFRYDRDSRKLAPAPALPRPTSRSESGAESR